MAVAACLTATAAIAIVGTRLSSIVNRLADRIGLGEALLLAIVIVGVAAPPVSVLGAHPVTVLLVAAYGYRLVLSRKTSESHMAADPDRRTEEDFAAAET